MPKDRWGVDYENIGTFTPSGKVTTKPNYTTDAVTADMAYAIKKAGGDASAAGAADRYAENLLNRIGSSRADGSTVSRSDVINELNRLGYKTKDAGDWTTVGGQQYLTSGDDYDWLKKTYSDLGINPNIYGGNAAGSYVPAQGYTVGQKNDQVNGQVGGDAWGSYLSAYQDALNQQLEAIAGQKAQAAEDAENQKRQAYVAWKQGQKALKNQLSASGLNDSGFSETSNIALSADYGNQLGTINSNLNNALQGINENYANTALSGAGTMANLAQQEYANRVAQQQWQAQQEQQARENAWYEENMANQLAQQELENNRYTTEQAESKLKAQADAALSMGIWSPTIEQYYGLSKADVQKYYNSLKKKTSTQSSKKKSSKDDEGSAIVAYGGDLQGNNGGTAAMYMGRPLSDTAATKAENQRLADTMQYGVLAGAYGLDPALLPQIREIASKNGMSMEAVMKAYANQK